ncbi:MAG TPA: hypothetical protein VGT01_09080 [Candidatus Dormibacteraeota bacterium]|nr:hypothetical protein [Candidatus Dormibacteraeota bacterium]
MDYYSREGLIRERHQAMVRAAEERARLHGWGQQERLSIRVATQLRRLADRIDGRQQPRVWTYPG